MQTRFDPLAQKYPSQRYPIYARGGMVNTSSPQASAAGLAALQRACERYACLVTAGMPPHREIAGGESSSFLRFFG